MSALRSLFEMYGALDEAVMRSADPRVARIVDQVLPGASANPGWYRDLEDFFFGGAATVPDAADAADAISSEGGAQLTLGEKSRLFAAAVANDAVAGDPPQPGAQPLGGRSFRNSFVGVMDLLKPPAREHGSGITPMAASPAADSDGALDVALDEIREGMARGESLAWAYEVAYDRGILDPMVPPMNQYPPAIVKIDGVDAVVVDSDTVTQHISLNQIKAVVNPYNWADNYGAFFLSMAPSSRPRHDGWPTVVETVGFGGLDVADQRTLKTALKYYLTGASAEDTEARIDYDLDDPCPGDGDGTVRVDRGYINMWARNEGGGRDPNVNGVAIRTRKVVHIDGLAPDRQARLLQISGYGLASTELLIEPAMTDSLRNRCKGFDYPLGTDSAPTDGSVNAFVEPGNHFAPTAVALLTETARANANDYLGIADKWMAGSLSYYDLAEFSTNVSGRLARAPWRFIEAMSHPRRIRPDSSQEDDQ